jgi:dihydrolipoamide dehydrogenase
VIATGSTPRSVPGVEIDRKRIITSDEAIDCASPSMVILGSGAVGVEFASIFRRFGSQVTIIELLPRIVPAEDEAISAELEKSFKKQGITVYTGTKVTKAAAGASSVDGDAQLPDGTIQKLTADYLLVATGRGPVTQGLGVEALGLNLDRGYVAVDNLFRTGLPGFSAVGDVVSFARRSAASAARARVVDGRHRAGRAHRRTRSAADQLRPCARMHVLRPGDRQRRTDGARSTGKGL